ncbi:CAP domain-containing protein [Paenibacillus sp. HJGM_3]|uniref:CAP domain-containing protein n=1 Tax=Paenibacillus sp. HJGM_3 TaxID=3379816 RepID=UPI00385F60B5
MKRFFAIAAAFVIGTMVMLNYNKPAKRAVPGPSPSPHVMSSPGPHILSTPAPHIDDKPRASSIALSDTGTIKKLDTTGAMPWMPGTGNPLQGLIPGGGASPNMPTAPGTPGTTPIAPAPGTNVPTAPGVPGYPAIPGVPYPGFTTPIGGNYPGGTAPTTPARPTTPTTPVATPAPTASPPASDRTSTGDFEQQVLQLVNSERAKAGMGALAMDAALSRVAKAKAEDMYNNNYFDHNSPTYGSPFDMMKKFGISFRSAGENIAKGQTSPQQVMNDWMNSPGHRANILNTSYTKIGIAFYNGEWVQEFTG